MPALIGFVCGCGFTGGCWLVVTGLRRSRRRRDLAERLGPFAPTPLADEVEDWLHHHGYIQYQPSPESLASSDQTR